MLLVGCGEGDGEGGSVRGMTIGLGRMMDVVVLEGLG